MKVTIDTQDPSTWPRGHHEMAVWHPGDTDDVDGALERLEAGSMSLVRRVLLLGVGVLVLGSAWPWLGA